MTGEAESRPEPVEAPRALDVDGVVVVALGTLVWLALAIASVIERARLRHEGHLWWIAAAWTGFGLGLLGIDYCLRRRRHLTSGQGRAH